MNKITPEQVQQIATDVAGKQFNIHERQIWEFGAITLDAFAAAILSQHGATAVPIAQDTCHPALSKFATLDDYKAAKAAHDASAAPLAVPLPADQGEAALLPAVLALDAAIHKVLIAGGDYGDELSDTSLRNTLEKAQHIAYQALISIEIERIPGAVNPLSAFLPKGELPATLSAPAPAAEPVLTWRERLKARPLGYSIAEQRDQYKDAEIADLRAALAAAPVELTANELRAEFESLQFNAQRLRNVVKLLGMDEEVPTSNAGLDGARGAVLGMIAAKLRTSATTGAGSDAEDAARYRYLRNPEANARNVWEAINGMASNTVAGYGPALDAAIDVAIAREAQ